MNTRSSRLGSSHWTADSTMLDPADKVVQLAGSDPERAAVTILNDTLSTGDVFLVPTQGGGQAKGGVRVPPGAGFVLETTAAVYGYAVGGAATVYAVGESGQTC